MEFHREALDRCGAAAKSASGAFAGLAAQGSDEGTAAYGGLDNAPALAAAVAELRRVAGENARTLGSRMQAVEQALDAVERTFTGADGGAVRR
ncbi:hypothetical protein ABT294_02605 [Nonomuraea sp. NPDC000554]|uniref:hypothetical protein n=1 Tax=Nonomuraea sp. NPDC000554 TaxID=3154259 RepID=UPI003331E823